MTQNSKLQYAAAKPVGIDEIPVIDLQETGGSDPLGKTSTELAKAASETGFFYVTGHGVPAELCTKAMTASRRFFELPTAAKARIEVNQFQRGWMRQGLTHLEGSATHDAKEVFFWGRDVDADEMQETETLPLVHPNQWPDQDAPFLRTEIVPYYTRVMALGLRILEHLAIGLDVDPAIFKRAYEKPLGRGQLVYYPPICEADIKAKRFGAAPHTDFGVLTVLQQDHLGGLQIMNRSGEWIEAPPIEGTFVCNIGDLLERWTNGKLVSTTHRVLNRSGQSRYSIPIFCDPASDTMIDPRDFDAGADIEARQPIAAGEYIMGQNRANFSHYRSLEV
jgi:isopenicillin N synthase-like dioxygenase